MSIALMVRIEALERRLAAAEAEIVRARNALMTQKPAPSRKRRRRRSRPKANPA